MWVVTNSYHWDKNKCTKHSQTEYNYKRIELDLALSHRDTFKVPPTASETLDSRPSLASTEVRIPETQEKKPSMYYLSRRILYPIKNAKR